MKNSNTGRLGFTLIELLVVVLIIGILAAVALPQYQKAVWKARNVQLKTLVKTVAQACDAYALANNEQPTRFDQLDIDLPLTATPQSGSAENICALSIPGSDSVRDGSNFRIVLNQTSLSKSIKGVWTEGPYKCTGFSAYQDGSMKCVEGPESVRTITNEGDFCVKIEKGRNKTVNESWVRFELP